MSWHRDGQIHITWGPEGDKLSPEEKDKAADELIAKSRERMEMHERAQKALEGLPFVAVPVGQLADVYERMLRLVRLGQSSIEEWTTAPEPMRKLRSAIFRQADFGAVYAGQWLPREVQNSVREKVAADVQSDNQQTGRDSNG